MTEIEAQQLIVMMSTAWPDGIRYLSARQQEETQGLYRMFLLDLPYDAANAALTRMIAASHESPRWPAIATLRREIAAVMHGRQLSAGEAWGVVLKLSAPRDDERWAQVDPLIRRCCDSMGWVVRDTIWRGGTEHKRTRVELGEHEPSDRARFCELYDELSRHQRTERTVGQLAPPTQSRIGPTTAADAARRALPKGKR